MFLSTQFLLLRTYILKLDRLFEIQLANISWSLDLPQSAPTPHFLLLRTSFKVEDRLPRIQLLVGPLRSPNLSLKVSSSENIHESGTEHEQYRFTSKYIIRPLV
ncbi:hypothetical protein CEXT_755921 [Caerostris extrusa]|uniref:Uncharacterized protein n=1 Tax=Caerostris extrusa TaxID=172846 RepID=A0AAV4R878_CAEEX|nr:hypothetical protein CEXT_755921 [Caerostris extrusa]